MEGLGLGPGTDNDKEQSFDTNEMIIIGTFTQKHSNKQRLIVYLPSLRDDEHHNGLNYLIINDENSVPYVKLLNY